MTDYDARAQASTRHLVPVPLEGLATAHVAPTRHVVDRIIPMDAVTLLGGHGGSGKSQLALAIGAHVSAGKGWGPFDTIMAPVLAAFFEDPADVTRYRLRKIIEGFDLDPEAVEANLTILDGTESDPLAQEVITDGIRHLARLPALEELEQAAKGRGLVIVDNASDALDGNENDRRIVRSFMRQMLGKIARENNSAVLLLAHIDKAAARYGSGGNTYSGSTAWHNSARSRLALVQSESGLELVQSESGLELVHEKSNYGPLADPVPLAWTPGGLLVPVSAAQAMTASTGDDAESVLEAMQAAAMAEVDIGAARTGPTTAQTVLATFPELPDHLRGPKGRKAFWSAVGRLQLDGRIRTTEIRTAARHVRKVLVIAA